MLFFKRRVATANNCNTVAFRKRRLDGAVIVARSAVTGYDDELKFFGLFAVQKFFCEFPLLTRCHRGFVEVNCRTVVELHIRGFLSRNGRYRKRAEIRRRRAYRRAVGVGSQVGRPVCATKTRAVRVTCRNDEVDTRRIHLVVNFVRFVAVLFTGETAVHTEGHVDNVCTDDNTVGNRCQNIIRVCASCRVLIREHFTDHELRVGRNTDKFRAVLERLVVLFGNGVVLTCDNTCNVHTVRVCNGEYVGIFIRVVVGKRYFCVIVDVLSGDILAHQTCVGSVEYPFHVLQNDLFRVRHRLECVVCDVQTGVEYRHQHAVALIFHVRRIVNTRAVNVNDVDSRLNLRYCVYLRKNNVFNAVKLTDFGNVFRVDYQRYAV